LSVAWAGVLWIVLQLLANSMDYIIIPINVITGAIAIVVVSIPACALGYFAMRFPRIVRLNCRNCGWKERYLVNEAGKIV